MEFHELANVFPLLEGGDFEQLKESIRVDGLQVPLIRYEGKILDGRNRYRACEATGTTPRYEDYPGDDPARFVLALNVARRHLTPSQAAMAAAKIANLSNGGNRRSAEFQSRLDDSETPKSRAKSKAKKPDDPDPTPTSKPVSAREAAKLLGVHRDYVFQAKKIQKDAVPEVVQAVESGKMTVKAAHALAKLPPAEQRKALACGSKQAKPDKEVKHAVQGIQMVGKVGKKVKRKDMVPQVSHNLLVVAPFLYFAEQAQRVMHNDLIQDLQAELDTADEEILLRLEMSTSGFKKITEVGKYLDERGYLK